MDKLDTKEKKIFQVEDETASVDTSNKENSDLFIVDQTEDLCENKTKTSEEFETGKEKQSLAKWLLHMAKLTKLLINVAKEEEREQKSRIRFFAADIQWDKDDDDYDESFDLPIEIELPRELWINGCDIEDVSDYISNQTGYCHEGFVIECNYSHRDLCDRRNVLTKDLEEKNRSGESKNFASLEVLVEETKAAILFYEEGIGKDCDFEYEEEQR